MKSKWISTFYGLGLKNLQIVQVWKIGTVKNGGSHSREKTSRLMTVLALKTKSLKVLEKVYDTDVELDVLGLIWGLDEEFVQLSWPSLIRLWLCRKFADRSWLKQIDGIEDVRLKLPGLRRKITRGRYGRIALGTTIVIFEATKKKQAI